MRSDIVSSIVQTKSQPRKPPRPAAVSGDTEFSKFCAAGNCDRCLPRLTARWSPSFKLNQLEREFSRGKTMDFSAIFCCCCASGKHDNGHSAPLVTFAQDCKVRCRRLLRNSSRRHFSCSQWPCFKLLLDVLFASPFQKAHCLQFTARALALFLASP